MKTIAWNGEELILLDQTKLPTVEEYVRCIDWRQVAEAIKMLRVRGAPAIGVSAAYGMILAAREAKEKTSDKESFLKMLMDFSESLENTRPTAVNLHWAIAEILKTIKEHREESEEAIITAIIDRAKAIEKEDEELCARIGKNGASLFTGKDRFRILTHCNTGTLATAGIGTALGVIYTLHDEGKIEHVYADETRPLLQGARLTAFELKQHHVPSSLLTDNMAAYAMQKGLVDAVIVGADRITTEGDVANKIGTYGVAVLAKYHNIPFYVAAPFSTFDFSMAKGEHIPIEQRDPQEVLTLQGVATAPKDMDVLNPAFDVTPHELITGIITEEGVITGNLQEGIAKLQETVAKR